MQQFYVARMELRFEYPIFGYAVCTIILPTITFGHKFDRASSGTTMDPLEKWRKYDGAILGFSNQLLIWLDALLEDRSR